MKLNDSKVETQVKNYAVIHLQTLHGSYLMSSANQVKVMSVEEFANNIGTKRERYPPVIFTPALYVLVRVRPQQVTQQTYRHKNMVT